jgi:hypothetical protein
LPAGNRQRIVEHGAGRAAAIGHGCGKHAIAFALQFEERAGRRGEGPHLPFDLLGALAEIEAAFRLVDLGGIGDPGFGLHFGRKAGQVGEHADHQVGAQRGQFGGQLSGGLASPRAWPRWPASDRYRARAPSA